MITVETRGAVVVVQLDHGKVNALDLDLLTAITDAMTELGDRAEPPAVVLIGARSAFCAGVDLRQVVEGGAAYLERFLPALSTALLAVFDHPRPVVAAVNGHAIAGWCILAAACDLRLMSSGTIGLTEMLVGVPFPTAPLEIMRYAVGPPVGRLALTGRPITPDDAVRIGLIDEIADPAVLLDEAIARATTLAALPAEAYALAKSRLHGPARERIDAVRERDDPEVTRLWQDPATLKGIAAYLDALARRDRH